MICLNMSWEREGGWRDWVAFPEPCTRSPHLSQSPQSDLGITQPKEIGVIPLASLISHKGGSREKKTLISRKPFPSMGGALKAHGVGAGRARARAGGPRPAGRGLLGFSVHTRHLSHLNLAPQTHAALGRRAWAWQAGLSHVLAKVPLPCWATFPLPAWAPGMACDSPVGPQGGRCCLQPIPAS